MIAHKTKIYIIILKRMDDKKNRTSHRERWFKNYDIGKEQKGALLGLKSSLERKSEF